MKISMMFIVGSLVLSSASSNAGKIPKLKPSFGGVAKAPLSALSTKVYKPVSTSGFTRSSVPTVKPVVSPAPKLTSTKVWSVGNRVAKTVVAKPTLPVKNQANKIIPLNSNKNRVTLRSPSKKMKVDLAGKSHANIPTPHTKVTLKNKKYPEVFKKRYNNKESTLKRSTTQDLRLARKYLEKKKRGEWK